MSFYDERLDADIRAIRNRLRRVATQVEDNLRHAVQAVLDLDMRLANETMIKDRVVNLRISELDHLCHLFVVRYLPSGSHLRFISAVLRLSVALERVGDYAVAICRAARQVEVPLPATVRHHIEMMGRDACKALGRSAKGFLARDPAIAYVSGGIALQTAATYEFAVRVLTATADADRRPARDLFAALLVFRLLQRTAEQAENVSEMTLFAVEGLRKKEPRYRILFLDRDHSMPGKLAEIAVQEGYPHAGRMASAGLKPAAAFDEKLLAFCGQRGIQIDPYEVPRSLGEALDVGPDYHVVVGLGVDPSPHFDIPHTTAVLEWDLAEDLVTPETSADELYRILMIRVRDLMATLGVGDAG